MEHNLSEQSMNKKKLFILFIYLLPNLLIAFTERLDFKYSGKIQLIRLSKYPSNLFKSLPVHVPGMILYNLTSPAPVPFPIVCLSFLYRVSVR